MTLEQAQPAASRIQTSVSTAAQPKITSSIKKQSEEAYLKMIKTAYTLALEPTLPSRQFKTLVKVQRENGVRLIEGKDDSKAVREYLSAITDAIREKVAVILCSANFFALLSDGSQARKTGADKEMVMVRVERNGNNGKIFLRKLCHK